MVIQSEIATIVHLFIVFHVLINYSAHLAGEIRNLSSDSDRSNQAGVKDLHRKHSQRLLDADRGLLLILHWASTQQYHQTLTPSTNRGMLPTFSNQQADLCVGELLHSVALPRHQPQDAHEGPHVADAPRFLLQLLPLCCLVDAGEDVRVGITQCTEQCLTSGIFPNHLKQETEAMQEVEGAVFISVQGALCACETYAPGGSRSHPVLHLCYFGKREKSRCCGTTCLPLMSYNDKLLCTKKNI